MKFIQLTQGKFTIVDDEDYERLNEYKWCAHKEKNRFYAVNKNLGRMHRVILELMKNDGKITDHKNRNGLDNRRQNLRIVTRLKNAQNHKMYSNNISGHNGIGWWEDRQKWSAHITTNKKRIHLGYFEDLEEAVKARKKAEEKYWNTEEVINDRSKRS